MQGSYTTTHSPTPPAQTVRHHLTRCRELVLDLHHELSAAAIASLNAGQALRLSALARGCESLTHALLAISKRAK